jgi:hypothetical protein
VRDVATDTPKNVLWVSPSVTTGACSTVPHAPAPKQLHLTRAHGAESNLYPSYRVFVYNRTTFEVLDVHQYTANFTRANEEGHMEFVRARAELCVRLTDTGPLQEISYKMREEYNLTSVTADDMHNLVGATACAASPASCTRRPSSRH